MVRVSFTSNLARHVGSLPVTVRARTVREALDLSFDQRPKLREYVLDEGGALRTHMVVFVNGRPIRDRVRLSDELEPDADVQVIQALSGG